MVSHLRGQVSIEFGETVFHQCIRCLGRSAQLVASLIPDTELCVNFVVCFEFVNECNREILHRDVTLAVFVGDKFARGSILARPLSRFDHGWRCKVGPVEVVCLSEDLKRVGMYLCKVYEFVRELVGFDKLGLWPNAQSTCTAVGVHVTAASDSQATPLRPCERRALIGSAHTVRTVLDNEVFAQRMRTLPSAPQTAPTITTRRDGFRPSVDLPANARSYGADGQLIEDPADIKDSDVAAVIDSGPTVLDVLVHD